MEGQQADRKTRVREIAYRLWEEEGHPEDAAERHWLTAEVMLEASVRERKAVEATPPDSARKGRPAAAARSA